jgi:hypothetical protein
LFPAAVSAYSSIVKVLAIALSIGALATVVASSGGAAAGKCGVTITGGSAAEKTVARTIVCRMPSTLIGAIQINEHPPDAPSDTVWLAITVPRPSTAQTLANFLIEVRGQWDSDIAAAAIRDGFVRSGLRRIVAYDTIWPGVQPDPNDLYGIALPRWGIKRWETGAPSRNLGKRGDSWPVLQAKLNALSRRYQVKTTLTRYQPLGKAPLIWISTPRAARFLAAGGFQAYERTLHFREARYDGVFIVLISPPVAALAVFATYRGRQGEGCGGYHQIRGANKICPSQ